MSRLGTRRGHQFLGSVETILVGEQHEGYQQSIQSTIPYEGAMKTTWKVVILAVTMLYVAPEKAIAESDSASQEFLSWCDQMKGKEYWLRTDVIRVQNIKATDATNVFPDGRVYHQGTIQKGRQISAQTPAEFTAEARRKLGFDQKQSPATILTLNRGSRVLVHDIEVGKQEVRVQITLKGSWYSEFQSTIRLKFEPGYSVADLEKSFFIAFAAEEYEVKHADASDEISAGMSPDEVTRILGYADKKIELSGTTVLIYDALKLIFKDEKLAEVE